MAHRVKLTKAKLDNLSLEKDGQWVTDSEVPQLVVRLTPTSKTFVARWTSKATGDRNQIAIGKTDSISIANARDAARKLVAADNAPTVETLRDIYNIWEEQYSSQSSEGHAENFRGDWKNHIEPAFGKKKLSRLSNRALQEWYNKKRSEHYTLQNGTTSEEPYSAATVKRWIGAVSRLCAIARKHEHMTGNPCEGLEMSTPRRRLDLFTLDDVKTIADNLTAVQENHPTAVGLLRFLMTYPCRGKEAREMLWSDLDLDAGTWTIPADRYKTRVDKVFPLGPLQIEHLQSLPRLSEKYVFPQVTDSQKPILKGNQYRVWNACRTKPLGAHTMRKTIGTMMLNKDVPLEVVSKLMGHSSVLITQQVYAHLEPQTAAKHLAVWSSILEDDIPIPPELKDPEMKKMFEFLVSEAVRKYNEKSG